MDIRDVSTIAHSLRWTIPALSISQHIDCRIWLMFVDFGAKSIRYSVAHWFRCGRINVDSVCVRSWANLWAEKDTNHLKVKWNEMYIQREMIEYRDDKHAEQTNEREENETHNWNIGQYTYINTYIWLENLLTKRFSPYFPIIQWKKARNRTRSEPKLNLCHCLSALIANGRPMF